jgi:hypothetical protein
VNAKACDACSEGRVDVAEDEVDDLVATHACRPARELSAITAASGFKTEKLMDEQVEVKTALT